MEFKKFSAGRRSYGTGGKPTKKQEENVNFYDPQLDEVLGDPNHEDHEALMRVILFLASCHTIIIDQGTYNSSSPDELALVNAAKQFGYEFIDKDTEDNVVILNKETGEKYVYKLLGVCEFSSDRKRQSCIFKKQDGEIFLMCKGADSVIEKLLSEESKNSEVHDKTEQYVNEYASEGLRTLYLAERKISQEFYDKWEKDKNEARQLISGREEAVAKVDAEIEGTDQLELIGSTAIEDRLQDEVANTIRFMKSAGIKVWVLTGDKVDTAINIGVSAGLLDSSMDQHIIQSVKHKVLLKDVKDTLKKV